MHDIQIIACADHATPVCSCGKLGFREFYGTRRVYEAKMYLFAHLESEFQVKVKNDETSCPLCEEQLELIETDYGLLRENEPSVVNCSNGHEFDAYFKNGTLFLFTENDSTHSPFSTSS